MLAEMGLGCLEVVAMWALAELVESAVLYSALVYVWFLLFPLMYVVI